MPCICIRRPSEAFLLDCVADCVGPAAPEPEPEVWRCVDCGEEFDGPRHSHGRAGHAPGCDGFCRSCPIEIECGPIVRVGPAAPDACPGDADVPEDGGAGLHDGPCELEGGYVEGGQSVRCVKCLAAIRESKKSESYEQDRRDAMAQDSDKDYRLGHNR
jgi:hypothetical protein